MIRFACPQCKKVLQVPPEQGGTIIACPGCKTRMQAPTAVTNKAPASAPPAVVPSPAQRPTAPLATAAPVSRAPAVPPPAVKSPDQPRIPQAPAPAPAAPMATPVPVASRPAAPGTPPSAWKWFGEEVLATARAPGAHLAALVRFGMAKGRGRSLVQALARAQVEVGQRLAAAGQGNPDLRAQIAAADEKLTILNAETPARAALKARREELLRQLGADACNQGSHPVGLEPAFDQARVAEKAWQANQGEVAALHGKLFPRGKDRLTRISHKPPPGRCLG